MSNPTSALQKYLDLTQKEDLQEELEDEGLPPLLAELQEKYLNPIQSTAYGIGVNKGLVPADLQKSYSQDFAGQSALLKSQLPSKYSLSDLEKDPEFIIRAERFMEEIGSKEDIFEYLRDPQFSISSAVQRSVEVGQWSDQAKEDYAWLDNTFANADLEGFKETMGMIKDLSIDLVFDPVNWLAALFAAPSAGLSLSARTALNQATKEGLRKISKSSAGRLKDVARGRALEAGKKTGQYGLAEGAAYAGAHDFFLQGSEKELGLRENIDLTQTALVGGIGAALGGILGGGLGAYTAYSPMLKTNLWRYANSTGIHQSTRGTNKAPIKAKDLRTANYNKWADEELIEHGQILQGLSDQGLLRLQELYPEGILDKPQIKLTRKTPKGKAWAFYNKKDNVVTINMVELEKRYADKAWTKPVLKGVKPLPENSFKTLEEFRDFVLYHEASHSYMKRGAKESKAAYENRTNEYALQLLRGETPVEPTENPLGIRDPLERTKKELDIGRKSGELTGGQYWLKRAILGYYGKSTSILADAAKDSVDLQRFLGQLRYDWNHTLAKGVDKVQEYTYEEGVSRLSSKWKVGLDKAIRPLLRATFKEGDTLGSKFSNVFNDTLKHDENEQLLRLLWEPDSPFVTYKDINGKLKTVYIKGEGEAVDPAKEYVSSSVIKAAKDIKGVTDQIAAEAIDAGLITKFQVVEKYFPRQFQHDKIVANKSKFISIIANSDHANPANAYASNKYSIVSEALDKRGRLKANLQKDLKEQGFESQRAGKSWKDVTENNIQLLELESLYAYSAQKNNTRIVSRLSKRDGGHWVDEDYFEGRNFLQEAMDGFGIKTKLEIDKVLGNQVSNIEVQLALGANYDKVWKAAKGLKAEAIVDNMLKKREMEFLDSAYLEAMNFNMTRTQGSFKNRVFHEIPDQHIYDTDGNLMIEGFEDFIDRDINRVLSNYTMSSARTITRAREFGKSESVFQTRYIEPIRQQLDNAGFSEEERKEVLARVKLLYKRTTGLDVPTWEDVLNDQRLGQKVTTITDWAKTSQQLAHLPLATLSSITEPLILLSRIDNPNIISREGFETGKTIAESIAKGIRKDLDRTTRAIQKFKGKKVYGMKDIDDETWRELYEAGLALEQATMQRLEGLYGEAPRNAVHRGVQNAFFHVNLLTQWTGAVQLAAFTTGKKIIRQNSEKLYKNKQGLIKLTDQEKKRSTDRLWEAGIDDNEAINWYKNSLNKQGEFDTSLAQGLNGSKKLREKQLGFYENYYQRGAARFAKEIILVPTTAAANRPLWHSHPAGQLFAQFAGYPTAFNNTILKRFAREVYTDPAHATPKIVGTTVLMTSVATLMNAIRSQGDSLTDKTAGEIVGKSIQRWGGMGPLEIAYRYKVNAGFGSGQLGSLLKAPAGPLAQDVIDMILYRKGVGEMTLNNLPFSAAFQMIAGDAYKDYLTQAGRKFDKGTWGKLFGPTKKGKAPKTRTYYSFAIGGEVNVPNAKKEPDEKIDRLTGLPYNYQAGVLGQDEEERFGFYGGGLIRQVFHGSPYRFNTFNVKRLGTGEGFHAYGPGFYFADDKEIAKKYAKDLTESKKDVLSEIEYRNEKGFTPEEIAEFEGRERRSQDVISTLQDDPNGFISLLRFHSLSSDNLKHVITEQQASSVWSQFIVPYLVKHKKLDNLIKSDDWNKIQNQIQETVYAVNLKIRDDQILDYDKVFTLQDPTVQKNLQRIYNSLGKRDTIENKTGEEIINSFRETYVPLEEALPSYEKTRLLNKKYRQPGARILEYNIDKGEQLLEEAGIKATRFLDGFSRAEGKGTSNWVVKDTRLIEISKIFGVTIPVAAGILAMIEDGASIEDVQRQGFKEGGVVGNNSDEIMSYLTKHSRMAAPYLDDGKSLRIYTKEEIKDYPKGITQTVYRHLKEGSDIEHLEDFELTDKIGVHAHTKNDGHQAGKVRIYNPLDLRKKQIKDFTAYNFMDEVIQDNVLQNIIVKHSKLTKPQAQERLKDLIADYKFAVKVVADNKSVNNKDVEYALNVKVSKEAKDVLNELGYDSILYNKKGETGVILFEPGQFRAIEGSAPMQSKTDGQMESLGFEREQRFLGGRLFMKPFVVSMLKQKYKNNPIVKEAYEEFKFKENKLRDLLQESEEIEQSLEEILEESRLRIKQAGTSYYDNLPEEMNKASNAENFLIEEYFNKKKAVEDFRIAEKEFEDALRTAYVIDKKAGKDSFYLKDFEFENKDMSRNLVKQREPYFLGGISKFMQQLSQKAVDVRNNWENVLDKTVEDPEEKDLLKKIIDAESGGDPNAVSKRGAKGIMQIMEETARQPGYGTTPFKGDDLFNVEENIRFGRDYMRGLKNYFGDWKTASIAYNWGPTNTKKWIERGSNFNRLPKETQKYIGKIYVQPVEGTAKKKSKNNTPKFLETLTPRYGIGVNTPVFKTKKEVSTYINELPRQTRSAVRGMLEGATRYSGLGSVMAGVELGAYEQARAAAGFRDSLLEGDIKKPSFLEAEDKYVKGIGKALSPGDIDPMTATVVEQAAGLTALGIGVQEGINLIRYFGPKAVTKVKSYFKENPKATVDEAVSGILNKEVSRRDVLKGMGTGAVATTAAAKAVPSLLGKGAGAGAKVAAKRLVHPRHYILGEKYNFGYDLDTFKKYINRYTSKEPKYEGINEAITRSDKYSLSEAKILMNKKLDRLTRQKKTIEDYFKKNDLDVAEDVTTYDVYTDERGYDTFVRDSFAGRSDVPDDEFIEIYSKVDEIYSYEFNNLNKRLDKIKKEKSPEFKGEKDGMEFYEIDGNPVIRKLDDEIFDDFDEISEYTRDYINDAEFNETSGIDPYWDKHILMPNASGLKKLNK